MAKRVVEIWKRGELCFAVWRALPSEEEPGVLLNVNTDWLVLRKEDGCWKVSAHATWWYTIQMPASAKPEEVEHYLLERVRASGVTDHSAMGRICYDPLPEDLAEAERKARQALDWWLAGKDELVLKAMHPKVWMAMKGYLTKFSAEQKKAREKMKGMKLVRL